MLLSHHLARARSAVGDDRGAADACDAVFRPRVYRAYRALVLPDCEVFLAAASTPDDARAIYRRMLDRWSGSFEHPAIAVARAHLER
jgi:hypothetical protein